MGLNTSAFAAEVTYELTLRQEVLTLAKGKPIKALTVNGGVPGPTIELTEGDTVTIHVHNEMDVDSSIHWHGILLPNKEDGVSYLTTPPIKPHSTHTFSFPAIQSGTYWYHSHTGLQEQRGVYGSIVIHPNPKVGEHYPPVSLGEGQHEPSTQHPRADSEAVVVLSDWTNENPHKVLKNLKRGLEWYGVKKKTKQSVVGAIKKGSVWPSIKRSFKRMPPMDLSDVAYDAFLINGKNDSTGKAKPGETVRLRLINASASTYFYVNYAYGPMTIVAADGLPVTPIDQDRILMAIAETYDVLVTVPESGQAEFQATAQDGSGSASYWVGEGEKIPAPDIPKPNMYVMAHDPNAMMMGKASHKGHMNPMGVMDALGIHMMDMNDMSHNHGGHGMPTTHKATMEHSSHMVDASSHSMYHASQQQHDMVSDESHNHHAKTLEPVELDLAKERTHPYTPTLKERPFAPYHHLKAIEPTVLPDNRPVKEYSFHLTGDMSRYIWTMNGKTLKESDYILINRGENVRFTLINDTMMHHPMHLHGHFFRVVNEQGDYSPLKHTVDVPPMGKRVIEFAANEKKDWFFHCHVLYHMKSGMARIVSYEDSDVDPYIQTNRHKLIHDPWYTWGEVTLMSQMNEGELNTSNTRNTLRARWEHNWVTEFDTELTYERYINRFAQVFVGSNLYREQGDPFDAVGIAGVRYLLPFMINTTTWVDHEGDFRFAAEQEIPITRRLSIFGEVEHDTADQFEWVAGANYMLNARFSLRAQYHSDFGVGGGLSIRF